MCPPFRNPRTAARQVRRRPRCAGAAQVGGAGPGIRRLARHRFLVALSSRTPRWALLHGVARSGRHDRIGQSLSDGAPHVVRLNLGLLEPLGIAPNEPEFPPEFPIARVDTPAARAARDRTGNRYAVLNPGAAWPNKRWPPSRLGAVARALRDTHGLASLVLWGPGEEPLAAEVVAGADGAATLLPSTSIADMVALLRGAALMVSGDTGPMHIAAAVGTPVVGIFGPTRPARNGPWSPDDVTVSRDESCECHHLRSCRRATMCLADIGVEEGCPRHRTASCRWASPCVSGLRCGCVAWRASPAEALARRRVTLGFVSGVCVLWLAEPTARSIAIGSGIAASGEALRFWAAGHLNKSREVTVVGALPLVRASAVRRVVGDGRRAGDRIRQPGRGDPDRRVSRGHADGGHQSEEAFLRGAFGDGYDSYRRGDGRGGRPDGGRAARRFSLAQAMANREYRAAIGFAVAVLLLVLKATYNGSFWRAAAGP